MEGEAKVRLTVVHVATGNPHGFPHTAKTPFLLTSHMRDGHTLLCIPQEDARRRPGHAAIQVGVLARLS